VPSSAPSTIPIPSPNARKRSPPNCCDTCILPSAPQALSSVTLQPP
jgi:hypothetical protein